MVIAFDVDGTLFDTKKEIISALNVVLKRRGVEEVAKEEENKFVGPSFHDTLQIYRYLTYDDAGKITLEFREEYKKHISESKAFTGLEETMKILRKNKIHVCIATNKPNFQVKTLMAKNNLYQYIETVKSNDNTGKSKSEMLKEIKEEIPSEDFYYMVGDTMGDLQAANEAGYLFIEASYGYGEFKVKNQFKIENLMDIVSVLGY
jgi:phosphoglycolate phosphatase